MKKGPADLPRQLANVVTTRLRHFPAVVLLGPRQCGKSTLASEILGKQAGSLYLDLERPSDLKRLSDPEAFFAAHQDQLVCLDEIQRAPDLFPVLRGELDRSRRTGRLLMLGSASPDLLNRTSETLAGRVAFVELTPFLLPELLPRARKRERDDVMPKHWLRGGFPRSFLAADGATSLAWREAFVTTFLERDLARLAGGVATEMLRRFWSMCAHLHGDLWNGSKVAGALGISHPTARRYLDLMAGAFMLRILAPLEANLGKRLVRSPKVYVRDPGILHALLAIEDHDQLLGHPARGHSWEGYVIEQAIAALPRWQPSFFRTAAGAECDLVLTRGRRTLCIECKASTAPVVTRGFWSSLEDLDPARSWVVAPVQSRYPLARDVEVVTVAELVDDLRQFESQ